MGYDLNMEQTQKLLMTPELRQAITVLQLSSLELALYVQQQLEDNPLLELQEDALEPNDAENLLPEEQNYLTDFEDLEWEEYFQDSSDLGLQRLEKNLPPLDYTYENFLSQVPTLSEHLISQLELVTSDPQVELIGRYLIGNIDENGYLQVSLGEVASTLEVSLDKVEETMKLIQTLDPPGVGARNLEECLLIQVEHLGIKEKLLTEVIQHHLLDLGKGRLGRVAQKLGVSVKEIQRIADILKTLDPKPGRHLGTSNDVRYIMPDIVIEKVGNDYVVLLNEMSIPRITINSAYRSILSQDQAFDQNTRRYVENKLNAAIWLIRSLEQRRLTLYKVASCLVELQRDFLKYGVKYLKPLNLKQVADKVGLHESTISRATSNKYVQTPHGVFEMKYFFSSGLSNDAGMKISAESIKKILQEIVATEDPKAPLNDQQIVEILKQKEIKISRRTVAKYRDELGIPPFRQRTRY